MADDKGGSYESVYERTLEDTSTWAVAVVCFVLLFISLLVEHIIHLVEKWLTKKRRPALVEALEKVKSELMLLGFISLLLTVFQNPISNICISRSVASTWRPCHRTDKPYYGRRLLEFFDSGDEMARRSLATKGKDQCSSQGKVAFVTAYGIHQLHIFIFVLAIFHILYCIITLGLGTIKMKKWKLWENETKTLEYQYYNAHLAPDNEARFDFQKYIQRSLEEDFKVVVGISPMIWFCAVIFLLTNTKGWYSYLWLPFIPLIIILLIGTKLQVIITKMGLRIQDRGDVVKGTPVVQPGDDLFWFGRPRFILFLVHFVLFLNAFQLAFFAWSTYEFGIRNCFHRRLEDIIIRVSMGVLIQVVCSYVTLPLYALVTQMGSTMKPTIFNDRVATALKHWHHTAKRNAKDSKHSNSATPFSSRPATPERGTSPIHLLHNYQNRSLDSLPETPRQFHTEAEHWAVTVRSPSPSPRSQDDGEDSHWNRIADITEVDEPARQLGPGEIEIQRSGTQHSEFTFGKQ